MRDSLRPSRDSDGYKMARLLIIGGAVIMIVSAVLIYQRRARGGAAPAAGEPADTEAPMKITRLVAPQPTKPIVQEKDTGSEAPVSPSEEKSSKRPKRMVKAEPQGTIDTAKYNAVINQRFGQVKACYERRLKVNPLLEGKVDVNININDRGQVNWITVNRDTVRDSEMLRCVKTTIQGWQFPPPDGGSVVVGKTFTFKKKGM